MLEISLDMTANLADIVGAGSIITGLFFCWFQIRSFKMLQRDAFAINLAQIFYNQDLALQPVPDGVTLVELRDLGNDYVDTANTVTVSFETMGLLEAVLKCIATIDLVLVLAGRIVATIDRELRAWKLDIRENQDQSS